jgi:hypothetical protein
VVGAVPQWVATYGGSSPYRLPEYLSGYGFSDLPQKTERLAAARDAALSQLSRQVRMRVTSLEDYTTEDDGKTSASRYVTNIQTASELSISGARFAVHVEGESVHVLAYIETEALYRQFIMLAEESRNRFDAAIAKADSALQDGRLPEARTHLIDAAAELTSMVESASVLGAIAAAVGPGSFSGESGISIDVLEALLLEKKGVVDTFQPENLEQALTLLAEDLGSRLTMPAQVMPLLYQDGDFSSSFGSRTAHLLEERLQRAASISSSFGSASSADSPDTAVIRGTYWVDTRQVELLLTARSAARGTVLAAVSTTIPLAALDPDSLRPANADAAFRDGQLLLDDRIVNGGLDVEVWTDRGRNEQTLVFTEGEELQFYFRVNQPAFLQLSYVLVTGETVLLEESFYIGIDRVNRVVALPYTFQVVPPYGVERLIVTAHAQLPPKPDVIPAVISGQWYEVFRSPEAAVAATRGLARVRQETDASTVKVGEASLVITTMAGERR